MKKLIILVVLTTLLVAPALPAFAGSGSPGAAGFLTWLHSWWDGIVSSVTGEVGPTIDPNGLQSDGSEAGPIIDPDGLTECSEDSGGEGGGCIDPLG